MKKIILYLMLALVLMAGAFAAPIDDIVSSWEMEEGASSPAGDSVGSNDLTLTNYAWSSTASGSCGDYGIDLTSGYMKDTATSGMANRDDITYNVWIKTTGSSQGIAGEPRAGGNYGIWLQVSNVGTLLLNTFDSGANPGAIGTTSIDDDDYHMVTGVISPPPDSRLLVYVDGVLEGNESNTADPADPLASSFTIGAQPHGTGNSFTGQIANAIYWDRALDTHEIVSVYENESTGTCYDWSGEADGESVLTVTAQTYNSTYQLLDFNVTLPYNSTDFTTTNGSVQISINESGGNISELTSFNITTIAHGHYINQEVTDYNITNPYIFNYSFVWLSVTDAITGLNLDEFTVTHNGSDQNLSRSSSTNESVYFFLDSAVYNFTFTRAGYISGSINHSAPTNYSTNNTALYAANSVWINIYNSTSLTPTDQTITVLIELANGTFITQNTTSNGTIYYTNLTPANYTFTFTGDGFESTQYSVNVGSQTYQTLNAYLTESGDATVIFTIIDDDTGDIIEAATFSTETKINGTFTLTSTRLTDVSGRTAITYAASGIYRFTVSKDGYISKQFILDPVLFNSYSVKIKRELTEEDISDYAQVSVNILPAFYKNDYNNEFSAQFAAPNGNLIAYTYRIEHSNGTVLSTGSGTNAYGEVLSDTITINGSDVTDFILLNYSYQLQNAEVKNFKLIYAIQDANPASNTILGNSPDAYNIPLFDRVIIATVTIIIAGAIGIMMGGAVAAGGVMLLLMGFFTYTAFLPVWATVVALLVLVLILARLTQ